VKNGLGFPGEKFEIFREIYKADMPRYREQLADSDGEK
jgi:hypothetical protein